MKNMAHWTMLDRDTEEWEAAWAALEERVDAEYVDPESGEGWQYMGTVRATPTSPWKHQFRHRRYVGRGRHIQEPGRTSIHVSASDAFRPSLVREMGGGPLVGGTVQ